MSNLVTEWDNQLPSNELKAQDNVLPGSDDGCKEQGFRSVFGACPAKGFNNDRYILVGPVCGLYKN